MMSEEETKISPILFGISGAIFGSLSINIFFWLFTIGMSFLDLLLTFSNFIVAPILVGIFSSFLGKKLSVKNSSTFWISFAANFLSLPVLIIIIVADILKNTNTQEPLLLFVIGAILGILLLVAFVIWNRIQKTF